MGKAVCMGCGRIIAKGRSDKKFHCEGCRNRAWRREHPRVKRRRVASARLSREEARAVRELSVMVWL
jgi:predicted RNA-binding Zn-ribbon protein involved in translation (DUF1610 family)